MHIKIAKLILISIKAILLQQLNEMYRIPELSISFVVFTRIGQIVTMHRMKRIILV